MAMLKCIGFHEMPTTWNSCESQIRLRLEGTDAGAVLRYRNTVSRWVG